MPASACSKTAFHQDKYVFSFIIFDKGTNVDETHIICDIIGPQYLVRSVILSGALEAMYRFPAWLAMRKRRNQHSYRGLHTLTLAWGGLFYQVPIGNVDRSDQIRS